MKISLFVLSFYFLFSMTSCKNDIHKSEFKDWWSKNAHNYTSCRNFGNVSFTAGYLPYEYFESQQEFLNSSVGKLEMKMIAVELRYALKDGANVMYFDISNEEQYLNRLKYFQDDFKSHCTLNYGTNSFVCKDVHIQPTSGITPFTSMLLYFSVPNKNPEELTLVFRDELFNNGIVKIRIANINNIPAIKHA